MGNLYNHIIFHCAKMGRQSKVNIQNDMLPGLFNFLF